MHCPALLYICLILHTKWTFLETKLSYSLTLAKGFHSKTYRLPWLWLIGGWRLCSSPMRVPCLLPMCYTVQSQSEKYVCISPHQKVQEIYILVKKGNSGRLVLKYFFLDKNQYVQSQHNAERLKGSFPLVFRCSKILVRTFHVWSHSFVLL